MIKQARTYAFWLHATVMSLTKLATALTVIFVISLVALIAELLFVLWRNLVFRRQTLPTYTTHDGGDHQNSGNAHQSPVAPSSKEQLLFFLCLRTHPLIDSNGALTRDRNGSSPDDPALDVFKVLGGFHGPSRVLCTIKEEEEREGVESDDSAKKSKPVCLQACIEVTTDEAAAVEEEVALTVEEGDAETTPYSTPCASPLYFTPLASPSREIESGTDPLGVNGLVRVPSYC